MDGGIQSFESRKDRVVADLTLPETLIVWALRKQLQGANPACAAVAANSSGPANLTATFSKIFGEAKCAEALEVFGGLATSLLRGARARLRINAYADEFLSQDEEQILAILTAFQRADSERAAMLVQWMIVADFNPAVTRNAESFANLLLTSGHSLNGSLPMASSNKHPEKADGKDPRAPYSDRTEDLTLGEAILLQGTRRWVACLHLEQEPLPVLEAHFTHYGIAGPAASLDAVLRNIAFAASRMVDVRGSACPSLSPDEADLLHAVAGFQRNDSRPAYEALGNWLPPAAIRLSADALSNLAQTLRAAGLILPLRATAATFEAKGHHPRSWHFESDGTGGARAGRTLH